VTVLTEGLKAILQAVLHVFNYDIKKMTVKSSFANETLVLWEFVSVMINW